MDGILHIGHAYTISKADFTKRYYELYGYNVLFPFAFHATGMPIVACAEKLKSIRRS
jgi:leucyl-tRNA synthetase